MGRRLGQHFLRNNTVAEKIIDALDIQRGDFILEIGPGHGELTIRLAKQCDDVGARLVAIERDEALAEALILKFKDLSIKNASVVSGDVLEILASTIGKARSFKLVGNLPYYLTGHLLRIISELKVLPQRCIFMAQKEVVERLVAVTPKMNRLAASVQFWAAAKVLVRVPRADFLPRPNVDSAVFVLDRKLEKPSITSELYYHAVRFLFAQPRKTILNNIQSAFKNRPKDEIIALLRDVSFDFQGRPQDLSIDQIAALANILS